MEFQVFFAMESNAIYVGISWDLNGFNGNYRQDFVGITDRILWELQTGFCGGFE